MHNILALPRPRSYGVVSDEDEASLVSAAQQDMTAFASLYERYRDRIYAYLRTRTNSPDDAADLTQQVFLQAIDALTQYRSQRGSFTAWLFGIARNAAIDFHRRQNAVVAWELLPETLHPVAQGDVENGVLQQEALGQLARALRTCPPGTREMLALRFAGRLSIAEIATIVGKSEAAVKKRLTRTIRTLKEQLS